MVLKIYLWIQSAILGIESAITVSNVDVQSKNNGPKVLFHDLLMVQIAIYGSIVQFLELFLDLCVVQKIYCIEVSKGLLKVL